VVDIVDGVPIGPAPFALFGKLQQSLGRLPVDDPTGKASASSGCRKEGLDCAFQSVGDQGHPVPLTSVKVGSLLRWYSVTLPNAGSLPMKNLETEDVWLRFFLRRLRLGLRNAKSPDTAAVLKEVIADAEERLDRLESGTDNGRAAD
jgi:hypothetical protein